MSVVCLLAADHPVRAVVTTVLPMRRTGRDVLLVSCVAVLLLVTLWRLSGSKRTFTPVQIVATNGATSHASAGVAAAQAETEVVAASRTPLTLLLDRNAPWSEDYDVADFAGGGGDARASES